IRGPRGRLDRDALRFGLHPRYLGHAPHGIDSRNAGRRIAPILGGDPARLRTDGAILTALICVAIATRLVPLTFSPLPFGIDGFALGRISSDIAARGGWRIDPADLNSYNQKLPGFSLLWSAVTSVGGLSPLAHVQLIMPLLASLSVIPAYLFGVKATGRRLGGFVAGLFIVLFGSFLLLTSSVSKESIGLLTFPVAVLLFLERRDPRKRALSVVLLLFLAFLHPLTTLLTLGMTSALVVLAQRRAIARGRFCLRPFALDVATGPALAVPAWAYYSAVDLPFLADLLAADALVLFLGIVILLTALIAPTGRPARPRTGQRFVSPVARGILVPAIGVLVVLGNARNGLFAGAVGTQSGLLQMLPAIGVLAAFGARNVTTDQRLADVGAMWFGYASDSSLPVKLRDNESLGGFQYALALERWTTVGAQVHPAPNLVISAVVFENFLAENRIVYSAGPPGDRIFIVQLRTSA